MDSSSYHYNVMGRALAHIENTVTTQPSLEEVSEAVGLSPAHFQRVFSQWVGVSPKRYQQYLTLDLAKRMLAERFTVLETTLETGLSGTSRLHDLFVRWEAMSPGEFAQGTEIFWDWTDSPFGEALVMATDRGICGLAFTSECSREDAMADMQSRWPRAKFTQGDARLKPWLDAVFAADGEARLHLIGAPFQIKVWEALLRVPTGHVTTYSEIAQSIGHPKAVRAVGTAVGRNPVSWLIPCHRALRKSGALGGYHWGLPVKRALLAWEAARHDANTEA